MSAMPYISEVLCKARNSSSERGEQNNEKLIHEIHCRDALWDQDSNNYGNRTVKVLHWEVVAIEMNQSVAEVKGRWKHLKNSFNREVRNMARSGNDSKWAHFKQMSFLLKGTNSLLLPRFNPVAESDSGYLSQSLFDADSETQNTASSGCENELSENCYTIPKEEQSTSVPKRKRHKTHHMNTTADTPTVVTEANSPVNWNENNPNRPDNNNEDYYFLMSLLPTFERLSPQTKMLLKIKFMQNVYEASFGEENSDLSNNGT